jgi:hypothetical protein
MDAHDSFIITYGHVADAMRHMIGAHTASTTTTAEAGTYYAWNMNNHSKHIDGWRKSNNFFSE